MHTVQYTLEYKRKLLCFNHPDELKKEEKALGNQKLIRENKALPIYDKKDLDEVIKFLKSDNKVEELIKITSEVKKVIDANNIPIGNLSADINESSDIKGESSEQLSLLD